MSLRMTSPVQITIRSVDPKLRAAIEREAQRRGQSLNRTVLALLGEATGTRSTREPETFDDLDDLAGTWSASEARRFEKAMGTQRQVDQKLWK